MKKDFLVKSPYRTRKLGEILAREVRKLKLSKAFVLGLEGALGGGKTSFLQGFARGLGVKEKITSPTFVIMKKFKIRGTNFENFYHFDCYRILKAKEVLNLGFKKIISSPKNIVALEWADRVKTILPARALLINFEFIDKKTRKIVIRLKNDR